MQVTFNSSQNKAFAFKERVIKAVCSKIEKITRATKSAFSCISSAFHPVKPPIAVPKPLEVSAAKVSRKDKFPKIDLTPTSSLIFNPNDGKYTYISPAPPIKNLVISGGGAKGVILLGVVQAFEEHKVNDISFRDQLDSIAGSSVGAITASLLAGGMSADDLLAATGNENFKALLGKGYGPLYKDGKPLLNFIRKNLQSTISQHLLKMSGAGALADIQNVREFAITQLQKCGKALPDNELGPLVTTLQTLLETLKNQDADTVCITFSMLKALRELNPTTFKDLTVTATCRENGLTYYLDASRAPNLDIALACRASASLPGILKPVTIDRALLLPGYVHACDPSFVDGGYLDNIPVNAVANKQGENNLKNRGEEGQNLQTLALIFDETGRKEHEQSPFHEVMLKKPIYNPNSKRERLLRDRFAKLLGGINTKERNTKTRADRLEEIRTQYSQRSIPLLVDLKATNFDKAKKNQQLYIENGKKQGLEYLQNHSSELLYRRFDTLEDLLEHLPQEEKENNLETITCLSYL